VYVIPEVPAATPYTTPVPALIVATDGLLLVHAPKATASDSMVLVPWQTVVLPDMGEMGLMLIGFVMTQPAGVR
jgi:hypothetical protein